MTAAPLWEPSGDGYAYGEQIGVHTPVEDERPVLALVHGLEDSWQSWQEFVAPLTKRYRCYALDMPWHAGSVYRWRRNANPAAWVDAAMDLLPERPTVVLAHSYGANAVLHWLAAGRPASSLQAVVLLAPFYRPRNVAISWTAFDQSLADFRRVMGEGLKVRLGGRAQLLDPEVLDTMVQKMLERIGPEGFLSLFEEFVSTGDFRLPDLDIPLLVIGGAEDPGIAGKAGDTLAEDVPTADVRLYPGLSHFCHVAQADEVRRMVVSFLDSTVRHPTHQIGELP